MKQHFKMAALSLAVISSTNAFAQDSSEPEYKNWFGLSGMYYNTDDSRPLDLTDGGLYDDGRGVAFEYGFRFTQSWAARVEFTALDLDYAGGGDESGEMVGVDALYFMPNDAWFLFGGVKRQAVGESTTLGNIGIGKHCPSCIVSNTPSPIISSFFSANFFRTEKYMSCFFKPEAFSIPKDSA